MKPPGGWTPVGRSLKALGALAALAACVLLVGIVRGGPTASSTAGGGPRDGAPPTSAQAAGRATSEGAGSSTLSLVQMNLCLSGLAECYEAASYPAVVDEAVARIQDLKPDAVTVNEACRRDAAELARRTGYHVRFARVIYAGGPLPCIDPAGRGLFGDAVLTKAHIVGFQTQPFVAQADLEQRRWLCVTTRLDVDVCTAHLETPHTTTAAAARDAQCAELAEVLSTRSSRAVMFGGDLNRREPCAPQGAWIRTDSSADREPGIQHIYGSAALRAPVVEVVPTAFSDHDMLVVRAQLPTR